MLGDICDQPTPDDSEEDEDENFDEFLPFNVGFIDKNSLGGAHSCKSGFTLRVKYWKLTFKYFFSLW